VAPRRDKTPVAGVTDGAAVDHSDTDVTVFTPSQAAGHPPAAIIASELWNSAGTVEVVAKDRDKNKQLAYFFPLLNIYREMLFF
jgi:hypothetical protein